LISDGIDLVNKISASLSQDARSVVIEVVNFTSRILTKGPDNFSHGGFGQTLPHERIGPFSVDAFSVTSDGLATGVEGSVTYSAEQAGDFLIGFDNPFVGTNGMKVNSNPGTDAQISIIGQISNGNHAHARFSVFDRTEPFPNRQHDWRACAKCQSLFFGPFSGPCPAGGPHDPTGSFNYFNTFNARPNAQIQESWRACHKCQCVHFAGFAGAPGVCAAGGTHDDANSFDYAVLFNALPSPSRQVGWASCGKCRVLFFRQAGGRCPTGGSHDAEQSFDYALDFTTT